MVLFSSSNAVDTKFDKAVGHIEDIIMGKCDIFTGILSFECFQIHYEVLVIDDAI